MKDLDEIKEALSDAGAGTVVRVTGYRDSKGEVRDLRFILLGRKGYRTLVKQDLENVEQWTPVAIEGCDLPVELLSEARTDIIRAKRASLTKADSDGRSRVPDYQSVGGSLATHESRPDALYLLGLLLDPDCVQEPQPAQKPLALAKQVVARELDFPTRRYLHAVCLEDGKFEDVDCETKAPR